LQAGNTPSRKVESVLIYILMIIGFGAVVAGAHFLVDGAGSLARKLKVSDLVIGLTIVAVGTSIPELATSAMAAYKKNAGLAVGNAVGSNIFNIFFILGISSIIRPIKFEAKANIDIMVLIIASLLLFFSMFTGKKKVLDRWESVLFFNNLFSIYFLCHRSTIKNLSDRGHFVRMCLIKEYKGIEVF